MSGQKERLLSTALVLALVFMCVEVVGGLLSGSLSILADAVHLGLDAGGFAVALLAVTAARIPPSNAFTFGLGRAEALGAVLSVLSLWALSVALVWEAGSRCLAWRRGALEVVDGRLMFLVACFGVGVNLVLGYLFHSEGDELFHAHTHAHAHAEEEDDDALREAALPHDHSHSHSHNSCSERLLDPEAAGSNYGTVCGDPTWRELPSVDEGRGTAVCGQRSPSHNSHSHSQGRDVNMEAAYLHVLTDLLQSLVVAVCGLLIWTWPALSVLDPACTVGFSVLVVLSTLPVLRRALAILLEGAPPHLDAAHIQRQLARLEGVTDVHALRLWSLSSAESALTCHIEAKDPSLALKSTKRICRGAGISYVAIQASREGEGCCTCPPRTNNHTTTSSATAHFLMIS